MSTIAEAMTAATTDAEMRAAIEARNALMLKHQGLVHKIARGFRGRGLPLEDLVQCGNLGLSRAAEKFEPERGLRFSTFSSYWIKQAILKAIGNTARAVRVPLNAQQEAKAILHEYNRRCREGGCLVELTQVIAAMNDREPRRRRCLAAVVSVTAKHEGPPVEHRSDSLDGASTPDLMILAEHREQLSRALPLLTEDQRTVLDLRYGLDGSLGRSIQATAAQLGIGWRAAERIERSAIEDLRYHLNR